MNTPASRRILLCAGLIVSISMGIRHGFGFFLPPMTSEFGWTREVFAFALGIQNLMWGLAQPFTGALADRYGAVKVLVAGAVCYALGLVLMTVSSSGALFTGSAGLLLGLALSGCTYSVVFGVIGRNVPEDKRSQAMGLASAAGSFGQFLMVPVEQHLIASMGWVNALLILGAMSLLIIPAAQGLREPARAVGQAGQNVLAAAREAFSYPSFQMLMAGYFVCGFQLVFIGVHLPSYLKDHGLPGDTAAWALALIGLFNVFGTFTAGQLGARWRKTYLLSFIYLARAVAIALFIYLPLTQLSVCLFAAVMGFLWLSTVPLTNGVIATIFGVRHLGMLSGFVFFSHQVGSFLGVWLGGWLYDHTGSYDVVWYISIAFGIAAALVSWPIRERAIVRSEPLGQPA
ncbi:MFS transporter [Chitinimonas arctica]|uniref:MFS transporter n=1 Tax=Chitinimonas arctica TaxID=2594795 RepID=A0A516SJ23_9NEIS|nr:MFS transporter [Chitinimonas arctica]QDQ28048.1 MFS transporter [Chitinimonas arctica]